MEAPLPVVRLLLKPEGAAVVQIGGKLTWSPLKIFCLKEFLMRISDEPPEHFCDFLSDGNILRNENLAQHVDGCGHFLL